MVSVFDFLLLTSPCIIGEWPDARSLPPSAAAAPHPAQQSSSPTAKRPDILFGMVDQMTPAACGQRAAIMPAGLWQPKIAEPVLADESARR